MRKITKTIYSLDTNFNGKDKIFYRKAQAINALRKIKGTAWVECFRVKRHDFGYSEKTRHWMLWVNKTLHRIGFDPARYNWDKK